MGGSSNGASSSGSGGDGGASGAMPVLQHHTNPSRDGVYSSLSMTKTVAATLKLDATFAPAFSGNVYAQPLYVTDGPGNVEAFIVATESNHMIAVSGSGAIPWDKPFGTPATNATLPCGNINPLGITGTPVVDMPSRTIFFDAMTNSSATLAHLIHAISLDDGSERSGWPVNASQAVSGFDSAHQNQRGALALVGGVLYVPYGGHLGDCGGYHGWVIGVPISNPTAVQSWSTGSIGMMPTYKGGIWAAGGIASDGTSLFVSTGNTSTSTGSQFTPPGQWSAGEAVFKLGAGPMFSNQANNFYYPAAWSTMDARDQDLGGANPVPFDLPLGDGGVRHLVVALGKDGKIYLLDRDNLGGMATELSATQAIGGTIIGAPAVYTTARGTYVAFRGGPSGCPSGQTGGNIGVLRITASATPTATLAWCAPQGLGSPMVTKASNGDVVVWDANTRLYGYDGDTGAVVFGGGGATDVMASPMQYMNTPIGAGGRIVVATSGHLYVFHP
jgi:hypothetical protein